MNNATLINQDSGNYEYYTPSHIIELARTVMDSVIHTDPFSSPVANGRVKASRIYTKEEDALLPENKWTGNVWMNHPFGREMNKKAIQKLISEYRKGTWHKPVVLRLLLPVKGGLCHYWPFHNVSYMEGLTTI